MKLLYYDCFAGISGDMNLGAMIDLGVDADHLKSELKKLNIDEEFHLHISKEIKMGISGTKVTVHLHHSHESSAHVSQEDLTEAHHHHHHHAHHHHAHRNVSDINKIIDGSDLPAMVKETARAIFMHVALAEAKVHSKTLDQIHFHEVGATDSIVDIVGAAICFHALGIDKVLSRPIELGGGFVKCAHGTMPVPAPATAEILRDIPSTLGAVNTEATTPTGAAILKNLVNEFTKQTAFTILKTGYGIGQRDTEIPNVLRVYLAEENEASQKNELASMIECNIDDMNPEFYSYLMDTLFEAGASDVHYTPITMKKNRPAIKVSVLCPTALEQELVNCLLSESTTIGVKRQKIEKTVLKREAYTIDTHYGKVTLKKVYLPNGSIRTKPEFEDLRRIAKQTGEPIAVISNKILKEID